MEIGEMLGTFLVIGSAAGWAMHGVIGIMLALIYAGVIQRTADRCTPPPPGHDGPDCNQIRTTAQAGYRLAPYFLAVAILLLGIGVASGWIRPKPPSEP